MCAVVRLWGGEAGLAPPDALGHVVRRPFQIFTWRPGFEEDGTC